MSVLEPSREGGFYQEGAVRQIPRTCRKSDKSGRLEPQSTLPWLDANRSVAKNLACQPDPSHARKSTRRRYPSTDARRPCAGSLFAREELLALRPELRGRGSLLRRPGGHQRRSRRASPGARASTGTRTCGSRPSTSSARSAIGPGARPSSRAGSASAASWSPTASTGRCPIRSPRISASSARPGASSGASLASTAISPMLRPARWRSREAAQPESRIAASICGRAAPSWRRRSGPWPGQSRCARW